MAMLTPDPTPYYSDDSIVLHHGDCLEVLRRLPDASVDAVVTDPPYGLEFMGKAWDGADGFRRSLNPNDAGRASFLGGLNPKCLVCDRWQRGSNPCRCESPEWTQERLVRLHSFQEWCEAWSRECLRVLRPGGHMLAFGGTRTFHRLACAIEDAGFEIRDSIAWLYGSGFPKSLDVSKAIDKAAGADREVVGQRATAKGNGGTGNDFLTANSRSVLVDITAPGSADAERWQGWGTALKPAFEPVVVARKPLVGTVAANVLAHGTGALNIDGCRVVTDDHLGRPQGTMPQPMDWGNRSGAEPFVTEGNPAGRWPANVILDDSQADALDEQSGELTSGLVQPHHADNGKAAGTLGAFEGAPGRESYGDAGGASRFFYVAKADKSERVRINGTAHPTVKPLDLMRWLVRLVTPPGGTVLEPFAGSGTTVEACLLEGFKCIAIEREADYLPLIVQRINRRRNPVEAVKSSGEDGGLFDLLGEVPA